MRKIQLWIETGYISYSGISSVLSSSWGGCGPPSPQSGWPGPVFLSWFCRSLEEVWSRNLTTIRALGIAYPEVWHGLQAAFNATPTSSNVGQCTANGINLWFYLWKKWVGMDAFALVIIDHSLQCQREKLHHLMVTQQEAISNVCREIAQVSLCNEAVFVRWRNAREAFCDHLKMKG